MINASSEGICVEFWRKNNTTLVYPLSICRQVLNSVKTNPLNIIFDDFSIWLLGYRTEFSCLYRPQGHTFISTVWLWSTEEYVFYILSESPSLTTCIIKWYTYVWHIFIHHYRNFPSSITDDFCPFFVVHLTSLVDVCVFYPAFIGGLVRLEIYFVFH